MSHDLPGPSRAELAREVLLQRMRNYSEEFHCAGWLSGLEFLLWEYPANTEKPWVQAHSELVTELRVLANIAGGWWVHMDETRPGERGPVFIPLERWLQVLAEWNQIGPA